MANHGEWIGNDGYVAFSTETAPGTPSTTPSVFTLIDDETLTTSYNLEDQDPIFGNVAQTFQVLPGLRDHKGDITMIAEPNTAAHAIDMLLTRGAVGLGYTFTVTSANATAGATYTNNSQTFTVVNTIAGATTLITTGTGAPTASGTLTKASGTGDASITFSANVATPNTWPFTASNSTIPKSKTVDISTGNVVKRFVGVQASKIALSQSKNQLMLKVSVSALGSFQGAVLASAPTGAGPYTVVFDTTYDTTPTAKLMIGDLIRFYHGPSTTIDATVATIVDGKTITTVTNVTTMAQGDIMHLRPQTPSFTLLTPFLWSNTQFCFGSSASVALAAAQTQLEQGSTWEVDYGFESDSGSQRSGSADPAALIRMLVKPSLNIKKFFDTPDDVINFNQLNKTACVVRHYAISGGQTYELRVTFNHLVTDDPLPKIKSKAVNYSDIKYKTQYSQSDSQIVDIKVINGLVTLA